MLIKDNLFNKAPSLGFVEKVDFVGKAIKMLIRSDLINKDGN